MIKGNIQKTERELRKLNKGIDRLHSQKRTGSKSKEQLNTLNEKISKKEGRVTFLKDKLNDLPEKV